MPASAHPLREVFNGLRYIIKTGAQWRQMPRDLPPWPVFYQQAQRWLASGCFDVLIDDLRAVLRAALDRAEQPDVVIGIAARCGPRLKAACGAAMTEPGARKAPN